MAVSQVFIFHFKCYSVLHFAVCQLLCWAFLFSDYIFVNLLTWLYFLPPVSFQEAFGDDVDITDVLVTGGAHSGGTILMDNLKFVIQILTDALSLR